MGHFPQHHVMPGVLIIEAMAQVVQLPFFLLKKTRQNWHFSAVLKMLDLSAAGCALAMCLKWKLK